MEIAANQSPPSR